ncbi:MAG: hypothetical protein JNM93_09495 [Bacteriovoracaceae bacterium]|nr:hypothetical protein [Bacteriovoracaceae bacterium]
MSKVLFLLLSLSVYMNIVQYSKLKASKKKIVKIQNDKNNELHQKVAASRAPAFPQQLEIEDIYEEWEHELAVFLNHFEVTRARFAFDQYKKLKIQMANEMEVYLKKIRPNQDLETEEVMYFKTAELAYIEKLTQRYLRKWREIIGEETFQEYLSLKHKFNSQVTNLTSDKKSPVVVNF